MPAAAGELTQQWRRKAGITIRPTAMDRTSPWKADGATGLAATILRHRRRIPIMPTLGSTTPVLRMCDVAKAHEFYVAFLGFEVH